MYTFGMTHNYENMLYEKTALILALSVVIFAELPHQSYQIIRTVYAQILMLNVFFLL